MSKLPEIPAGYRIVHVGGRNYIQKKKRSRKRYKLSKAQRNKLSRAAKQLKIPALTTAANAPHFLRFLSMLSRYRGGLSDPAAQAAIANTITEPYLGVTFDSSMQPSWHPEKMLAGLVPNIAIRVLTKYRVFSNINTKLTKMGLPISLS